MERGLSSSRCRTQKSTENPWSSDQGFSRSRSLFSKGARQVLVPAPLVASVGGAGRLLEAVEEKGVDKTSHVGLLLLGILLVVLGVLLVSRSLELADSMYPDGGNVTLRRGSKGCLRVNTFSRCSETGTQCGLTTRPTATS